jgi:urease accessory protein
MSWHARLQLDYRRETPGRTSARFLHDGPLRILQSLYPEGDAICHNVLVHPPGGLVGGDTLDITVSVDAGAHGLVTTPGATRFYRSTGEPALQRVRATLAPGSRLEWLPLEALAYNDCQAHNQAVFDLQGDAELLAWDVTALGLPHASEPFLRGRFHQHLELPGQWLERARIDATDAALMDGPLGLAGHRCLATLCFASGQAIARARRELALETARAVLAGHALEATAGVTSPNDRVVVLRVLAPVVEPAMQLLRQVWTQWRAAMWQLDARPPRIWAM